MHHLRTTRHHMRVTRLLGVWSAAPLILLAAAALAQVPQTIAVDGVNDFNAANLLSDDTGDTETKDWCTGTPGLESPMDIKKVFVTNDANNLYIGFEYRRYCFASPQVNLGIAFSYGAEGDGGTTDPFSRKIAWGTIARKPDSVFYVVLDAFNYEVLYKWTGSAWSNVSATVNPAYGSGSNGLGMANDTGFEELSLPLSVFGVTAGNPLYLELWMTQDGTSKPPLDAVASDAVQTSTTTGTTFDVTTAVQMTSYLTYGVQSTVDTSPPLVTGASHPLTAQIDVTFNEPVDAATAGVASHFSVSGGTSPATVTAAARDGVAPNVVHLTLSSDLVASADAYRVTVNGVKDLHNNTIVANGVGNVGCFAVKQISFEGKFGPYLAQHSSPPDGFTVEGSKAPLTFALCDGASMTDMGVNNTWTFTTKFSFAVSCADNSGSLVVEWKFAHNCSTFESIGNRSFTLALASPSVQTISVYWDDLDPTAFTTHAVDVVIRVDMNRQNPGVSDQVGLGGSQLPLTFAAPFTPMVDDGTGQDATAGDKVYTVVARFPTGTLKTVEYKFLLNEAFECAQTGNRALFLNDQLYDTIGGAHGPLVLPLAYFDRCFVIGHSVKVVFRVDTSQSSYSPPLNLRLTGSVAPLGFDIGTGLAMHDDGVAPDAAAGDKIYSGSVVFPDSSNYALEYKYAVNSTYEGVGLPNRFAALDDQFNAASNPQILPVDILHRTVPVGIGDAPAPRALPRLVEARPNPFNPRTTLVFELPAAGHARLELFDARGRYLATLVDGVLAAGRHELTWDGRAADGSVVASGVYFARLIAAGSVDGLKVALVR
jgi:hypothetical protein